MQNGAFARGARFGALIVLALAIPSIGDAAAFPVVVPAPGATLSPQAKTVNKDAKIMADFTERVQKYVQVHRRLESKLPPIPKEATPQQIDAHQRALEKAIQSELLKSKAGDFFDKDTRALFRRHLGIAFSGPDGADAKAEIMDEIPRSGPHRHQRAIPGYHSDLDHAAKGARPPAAASRGARVPVHR